LGNAKCIHGQMGKNKIKGMLEINFMELKRSINMCLTVQHGWIIHDFEWIKKITILSWSTKYLSNRVNRQLDFYFSKFLWASIEFVP
jgi:hypothetical protein